MVSPPIRMHNIVEASPKNVKESGVEKTMTLEWRVLQGREWQPRTSKPSHRRANYGILWETIAGDGRLHLDLSCPVELTGYDLTGDARGVRGFVHFHNLSDKTVLGFEAVITWQGEGASADIPLRTGAIHAAPHEAFVLPLEAEAAPSGHWSGLYFVQVDFDGAPPWRGNPKRLIEVELPEKPTPKELEALRRVAGPDAAVRPLEAENYWVCACGRANPRKSPGCDCCGRSRRNCMLLSRQLAEVFKEELTTVPAKKTSKAAKKRLPKTYKAAGYRLPCGATRAVPEAEEHADPQNHHHADGGGTDRADRFGVDLADGHAAAGQGHRAAHPKIGETQNPALTTTTPP